MKGTLFVLLDGLEDDPNPDMGGLKPHEAADMPFLKTRMAHRYKTTGRGYTHLFLNEFFTGHPPEMSRAAIEAMGIGLLDVRDPSRTAYRLSPAEISDGMIHWHYSSRAYLDKILKSVDGNMRILEKYDPKIRFFIGAKAILTMESDYVPEELPAPPVDAPYVEVEGPLGEFIGSVKKDMDGITLCPWECGKFGKQYPPVKGLNNLKAFSNGPTALGICASMGYGAELIDDLEERFLAAKKALDEGDVFLHIDEIDEYSHKKDPLLKKQILEKSDRLLSEHFSDVENIIIFVDHGTSSITGEHILTDVPIWTSIDVGLDDDSMIPLKDVVETLLEKR